METERPPVVVIAAAGRAKRFLGEQKVLAEVGGVPAICRVASTCEEALGPHQQLVIIGHEGEQVRAALGEAPHRSYITQHPQLGTGHALATALAHLGAECGREVYFLCGDKPLLSAQSLRGLRTELHASRSAMAFLTGVLEGDPKHSRQGRVLQAHRSTPRAEVLAIVERATIDALGDGESMTFESLTGQRHEYTREQLLAVRDVNISAYVWRGEVLREHIGTLPLHPEKGEYFVTDLVHILRRDRLLVRAIAVCHRAEGMGIDTREQLAAANGVWGLLRRPAAAASLLDRTLEGAVAEEATDAVL